ncbi:hypothetical protein CEXT_175541 [Caerostris extrusa]|uniref:Uncharacterized protein n=1 Tax=Caerostris extrusa TaxID=172846 RepID=A0AAV4TVS2_CAEEX|nr:hypothetical protein CEXT_175541 [Caerostris extrusa]
MFLHSYSKSTCSIVPPSLSYFRFLSVTLLARTEMEGWKVEGFSISPLPKTFCPLLRRAIAHGEINVPVYFSLNHKEYEEKKRKEPSSLRTKGKNSAA